MTENLSKVPRRSILKHNDSEDLGSAGPTPAPVCAAISHPVSEACLGRKSSKTATFDEMNILLTLHPADKDYGHMKIDEPQTPYSYAYLEDEEEAEVESEEGGAGHRRRGSFGDNSDVDVNSVAARFRSGSDSLPSVLKPDGEAEEDFGEILSEEDRIKKRDFEAKRKAHYNEYMAVKMARKLIEEEDEEDED